MYVCVYVCIYVYIYICKYVSVYSLRNFISESRGRDYSEEQLGNLRLTLVKTQKCGTRQKTSQEIKKIPTCNCSSLQQIHF